MECDQLPRDGAALTSLIKRDCTLELGAETNTVSLEGLSLGHLIPATGKETKAATFESTVVGMPTHGKA